jgi:hypothetical protein
MSVITETCYDCGCDVAEGACQTVRACLWSLPGAGQHWAQVPICSACAGRRRHLSAALAGVWLLLAALTALVAYPLLP